MNHPASKKRLRCTVDGIAQAMDTEEAKPMGGCTIEVTAEGVALCLPLEDLQELVTAVLEAQRRTSRS